jgi:hypothetical protein
MREWYTTPSQMGGSGLAARPRDPAKMDVLEIGTKSPAGDQAVVDITSARMTNGNIAIHIHDDADSPGRTTLGALPAFSDPSCTSCTVFQTTADLFMPASDPPSGTITFRNIPRGDASKPQILNAPNWASDKNSITVVFGDYPQ